MTAFRDHARPSLETVDPRRARQRHRGACSCSASRPGRRWKPARWRCSAASPTPASTSSPASSRSPACASRRMPADSDHRFGHGKAEALVALVQIVLITLSALAIGWRSAERLAAGARNRRGGARHRRLARRDGGDLRADHVPAPRHRAHRIGRDRHRPGPLPVGPAAQRLGHRRAGARPICSGWSAPTPLFGLLIAAWLLWGAWRSSTRAINQLMDREWPEAQRAEFLAAAAEYPELAGLHDLRTRTSGSHNFVQFHVWVPGDWTVRDAHDRMDAVEEALQKRFPGNRNPHPPRPRRPYRPRDHAVRPT